MSGLGGGFPVNKNSSRVAAAALGIVTDAQVAYTRSGPTLALNPPLTHAFDQMNIDYYNAYLSDTWHMKPSFTLTYGLGYTLEMPPAEQNGKATVLVDASDEPVVADDYLTQRKNAALQGQPYNPELGFALVGNVGAGEKYLTIRSTDRSARVWAWRGTRASPKRRSSAVDTGASMAG